MEFTSLRKELTPSTDLDSDFTVEDDEALALMDDFYDIQCR